MEKFAKIADDRIDPFDDRQIHAKAIEMAKLFDGIDPNEIPHSLDPKDPIDALVLEITDRFGISSFDAIIEVTRSITEVAREENMPIFLIFYLITEGSIKLKLGVDPESESAFIHFNMSGK